MITSQHSSVLPVMEAFYTIQGEGYHHGKAAYFIRLGGCNVGCHWCDVKESWDATQHSLVSIPQITKEAAGYPGKLVVVTGGEPLMYDLDELTGALKAKGLQTNVETSGAYRLSGDWDWICFSPKKFKTPKQAIYDHASELKVVIYNKSDFKWAEDHRRKVNTTCKLYLQPEWSRSSAILPLVITYVKNNPCWEISLQIHKFMDIP